MRLTTTLPSFVFCFLVVVSGCASTGNNETALSPSDRIRKFDSEYYGTFNAITQALKKEGYSLETADGNNGLVYTDYQLASTLGPPISGNHQIKVEAVVEKRENGTQVTLTLRVQQEIALTGGPTSGVQEAEAQQYYRELFEKIAAHIE
jgi:hypothetical protein